MKDVKLIWPSVSEEMLVTFGLIIEKDWRGLYVGLGKLAVRIWGCGR
jgi:hypothetical protein